MNSSLPFRDITIYDEQEPCPYLEGQEARLPLQIPAPAVTPQQTDLRLAAGQRRTGEFVYATACPRCSACEPIRIPVSDFRFSRSHRRNLRRNGDDLTPYAGPVVVDSERVALFNRHRAARHLGNDDNRIDEEGYAWAFRRSCFDSFEFSWSLDGRIVCVALCDQGESTLSAVYTYYEPELARRGLGTWAILRQIQYCQATARDYLYLGFYIADSQRMSYKSRFSPHERRIDDAWVRFD